MRKPGTITQAVNTADATPGADLEATLARVVAEIRRVATPIVAREKGGLAGTATRLNLTAVVNEAWLKLSRRPDGGWQSRAHFFGAAARAVRQVLVNEAKKARRRESGRADVDLDAAPPHDGLRPPGPARVLAIDELLTELESVDARWARVAEMKLFGDLDHGTIAECLGVTRRTVERDVEFCRAWIGSRLPE